MDGVFQSAAGVKTIFGLLAVIAVIFWLIVRAYTKNRGHRGTILVLSTFVLLALGILGVLAVVKVPPNAAPQQPLPREQPITATAQPSPARPTARATRKRIATATRTNTMVPPTTTATVPPTTTPTEKLATATSVPSITPQRWIEGRIIRIERPYAWVPDLSVSGDVRGDARQLFLLQRLEDDQYFSLGEVRPINTGSWTITGTPQMGRGGMRFVLVDISKAASLAVITAKNRRITFAATELGTDALILAEKTFSGPPQGSAAPEIPNKGHEWRVPAVR